MKRKEKKENCGNEKSDEVEKFCQSSCKVCKSNLLKEIHNLRKSGYKFSDIIEIVKKKSGENISSSSLSRHFQNYEKCSRRISEVQQINLQREIIDGGVDEKNNKAQVVLKIDWAIDIYLEQLLVRLKSEWVKVTIADLQSLFNIRYRILADDQDDSFGDLKAIFNNAYNKYKISDEPARLPIKSVSQNVENQD